MFNICVMIGRVLKCYEDESDKKSYILLQSNDNILNDDGSVVTHIYKCLLWKGIYKDILSYNENVLVGIKGRLSILNEQIIIIVEMLTVLGK